MATFLDAVPTKLYMEQDTAGHLFEVKTIHLSARN
jgi:hypothetical protein